MRSLMIWLGVLVGSVALGVGLYGLVVRPSEAQGLAVTGATSAPSSTPTVYRYKTKVVKDPPKKKVVDVPAPAPAAPAVDSQVRTWSDSSGSDDSSGSSAYDGSSGTSDDSSSSSENEREDTGEHAEEQGESDDSSGGDSHDSGESHDD